MTKTDTILSIIQTLADQTSDAYMADSYGRDRWVENITELLEYGYNEVAVEWIVRSKIARWADDYVLTMLAYIQKHVGDVKLRMWMRDEA